MNILPGSAFDDAAQGTLVIASPNSLLNEAVAAAARAHDISDVRITRSAADVLDCLRAGAPTIVAIDLEFAVVDGFRVIRDIKKYDPSIRVVVLASDRDDPRQLTDCFIVGVDGMVSKDRGVESLFTVLDVVRRGEHAVPRWLTDTIIDALSEVALPHTNRVHLSARQKQVLGLVAEGLSDREIAERLHITTTTVRSHLAMIFEKTATVNRTAAARWLQATNDDGVV